MKDQYFVFNNQTKKIRTKCVILSGVSLFVGITETLPKKFSLVGLDLSENQEVLGWFIFFITLILFINFIVMAILEIIEYYLPSLIKHKIDKTTGDTLGFFREELIPHDDDDYDPYESLEKKEIINIDGKNTLINYSYKNIYTNIRNVMVFLLEFISPVIFSLVSMCYLYWYLSFLK